MTNAARKLVPIAGHESNDDRSCKLVWPTGGQVLSGAVYSCRKGHIALIDGMAVEGHFETLAEAKIAAQGHTDAATTEAINNLGLMAD